MNILDLFTRRGTIVETTTDADIESRLLDAQAENAAQIAQSLRADAPLVIERAGESFVDLRVLAQVVNAPAIEPVTFAPYVFKEYEPGEYERLSREGDAYIASLIPFERGANGRPVRPS